MCVLLSTADSHPLLSISSGLFRSFHRATKKILRRNRETEGEILKERKKNPQKRIRPVRKKEKLFGPRRSEDTGGEVEVGGEIKSARPYLAAAPCWV